MRLCKTGRTYALVTVATTVAFVAVGCGGSDWDSVTPHYTPETAPYRTVWTAQDLPLNAVRAFGANSIYALGASGTILHSIDGEHWTHQSSQTQSALNAIFGTPDGKKLWVVGGEGTIGTILHSTDGEHWSAQSSKAPWPLRSIFGTQDGTQLWAVGDLGTILHSTDGEHWTVQKSPESESPPLNSIFGTPDGKQLWAVGGSARRFVQRGSESPHAEEARGIILHSTDGEHWAARSSGSDAILYSIFGAREGKQLWAVGDTGTILHSRDGEHWVAQSTDVRSSLRSISGTTDGKHLWAVGEFATPGGKSHGTMLHSADGKH